MVRVFEDKRYYYDGHGRLIRKLSGKHTDQSFTCDDENHLTQVSTTRCPGTEHATTQTSTFDYDAIGRRIAKRDRFGTTEFIWEGMRLLEERRGNAVISYVYEPGSYVPLARLDADGELTEQGGLGTTQDTVPAQGKDDAPETIAADACQSSAKGLNGLNNHAHQTTAANDSADAQYWQALSPSSAQQQSTLGNGTTGQATLPKVYYFHADQIGMS